MAQITYGNKVKINDDPNIPAVNKGRDVDWNEVKQVVNENYAEQQATNQQVTNITGQILWTNPTPTQNFAERSVTLSSSDYDFYEIYFLCGTSSPENQRLAYSGKLIKNYGARSSYTYAGSGGVNVRSRIFDIVSATSIKFYDAYSATGTTAYSVNNSVMIPLYVIGYKTGLIN